MPIERSVTPGELSVAHSNTSASENEQLPTPASTPHCAINSKLNMESWTTRKDCDTKNPRSTDTPNVTAPDVPTKLHLLPNHLAGIHAHLAASQMYLAHPKFKDAMTWEHE